jgi:hypothetical protein
VKFLKSQGVVLVLAAIALILVGKNLVWPFLGPKFAKKQTVAQAPTPPASAPASAPQKPSTAFVPRAVEEKLGDALKAIERLSSSMTRTSAPAIARMDLNDLRARGGSWVVAPVRDPFKLRGSVNDKSAREQITLTGILRQTDSDLAVLNNQIMAVGETILGFRIETVEADRVWVSGPNGREALEFKYTIQEPKRAALDSGSELVTSNASPETK